MKPESMKTPFGLKIHSLLLATTVSKTSTLLMIQVIENSSKEVGSANKAH